MGETVSVIEQGPTSLKKPGPDADANEYHKNSVNS